MVYAIVVGRGLTCRLLSTPLLSRTLAPISYNVYLFHQLSQLYYLATRHEWWSYRRYRKHFFWFSPQPVPVGWSEYFVAILTTWLAMFLARIDPWLIARWEAAARRRSPLRWRRWRQGSVDLDIVLDEIEKDGACRARLPLADHRQRCDADRRQPPGPRCRASASRCPTSSALRPSPSSPSCSTRGGSRLRRRASPEVSLVYE